MTTAETLAIIEEEVEVTIGGETHELDDPFRLPTLQPARPDASRLVVDHCDHYGPPAQIGACVPHTRSPFPGCPDELVPSSS